MDATFFQPEDLAHQIRLIARQTVESMRSTVLGYVASYDPKTHRARWVIPSYADGDGGYVLTGWGPLGTGFAGNGFGIQIAPKGGATTQEPTKGELCVLHYIDRENGVIAGGSMLFNQVNLAADQSIAPGEAILKSFGGGSVYLNKNGDAVITTSGKTQVVSTGEVDVTSQAQVNVTAPMTVIGAAGGTAKPVMLQGGALATSVKAV